MTTPLTDYPKMIQDIELAVEADDINLSEWEDEFIQSIKGRDVLTEKQEDVLLKLWRRATT